MVWSHSWVDQTAGRWEDGVGYLQRRLSLEQAKKIAAQGGCRRPLGVGPAASEAQAALLGRTTGRWVVATRCGYAKELANLINWIGADHVGIGTDLEGVGDSLVGEHLRSQVRSVVETLQDMKLPSGVVEKVACTNFARVLKEAALRS